MPECSAFQIKGRRPKAREFAMANESWVTRGKPKASFESENSMSMSYRDFNTYACMHACMHACMYIERLSTSPHLLLNGSQWNLYQFIDKTKKWASSRGFIYWNQPGSCIYRRRKPPKTDLKADRINDKIDTSQLAQYCRPAGLVETQLNVYIAPKKKLTLWKMYSWKTYRWT